MLSDIALVLLVIFFIITVAVAIIEIVTAPRASKEDLEKMPEVIRHMFYRKK